MDESYAQFYRPETGDQPLPVKEVFNIENYRYIHSDIILFNQVEYADNEYEDSRFLFNDVRGYILFIKADYPSIFSFITAANVPHEQLTDEIILFPYYNAGAVPPPSLGPFFQHSRPLFLFGGIKISRSRAYLQNWGPSIKSLVAYSVIRNYSKISYDPMTALPGAYRVRSENYPDLEFSIVARKEENIVIPSRKCGWSLKSMAFSKVHDLEGSMLTVDNPDTKTLTHWIEISRSLTSPRQSGYKGQNILLNLLKRSRHEYRR